MPSTVRLHRVFATSPNKLYRAFLEADAMAKWLPPNGFTCTVHEFEPKVGGTFKMSFRNFTTGNSHSFGGEYIELVPDERLRYTDRFDDPNLPGEIRVTVELKKVSVGTEINIEQASIPDLIPAEAAISAGKNPCGTWQNWWSPTSTSRSFRPTRVAARRTKSCDKGLSGRAAARSAASAEANAHRPTAAPPRPASGRSHHAGHGCRRNDGRYRAPGGSAWPPRHSCRRRTQECRAQPGGRYHG